MPSGMCKAKGRRSNRKQGYYGQQYFKTAANKIRRLEKRKAFDPQAKDQIQKIHVKAVDHRPKK